MPFKFYTSVAKGLKLKVRKVKGLIAKFVEVTWEKLVGGGGAFFSPILNRVVIPPCKVLHVTLN